MAQDGEMVEEKPVDVPTPGLVHQGTGRELGFRSIWFVCSLGLAAWFTRHLLPPLSIERLQPAPVPTSMLAHGANLSPAQKEQLHEVASLVLDIYRTLADMRFINGSAIAIGPHDQAHLQPVFSEAGIDPTVAYLYSILPYVDAELAGNLNFFQGVRFADFRAPETVRWGRDPFSSALAMPPKMKAQESDDYMYPWITPLSRLGGYWGVVLYDAREHRVWIVGGYQWESGDPALQQARIMDNGDSGKRWDFEAEIPSRDASAVLRDINQEYRTLQALPCGKDTSEGWPETTESDKYGLKALYQKHGWPDHFDGDAFEVDQVRAFAAARSRRSSRWTLNEVEHLRMRLDDLRDQAARFREDISRSEQSKDSEWVARVGLMVTEKGLAWYEQELKGALREADRQCPDAVCPWSGPLPLCPSDACQRSEDLPLWEAAFVATEVEVRLDERRASLTRRPRRCQQMRMAKSACAGCGGTISATPALGRRPRRTRRPGPQHGRTPRASGPEKRWNRRRGTRCWARPAPCERASSAARDVLRCSGGMSRRIRSGWR